ncbi:MAG: hypothetical protein ACLP1X_06820 [Polyangiaceae bacterium]
MDLRNLIGPHLDLARLSKDLDELGHSGRLWSIYQWTRGDMAKLWDATKGTKPLTLDDFVPPSAAPLAEVIHHGKNSLPAHNFFQKRFCKPKDPEAKDMLVGFNYQTWAAATGPGYFVAHPSSDAGDAGCVDIDYTMIPKEKPDAWPPIEPNSVRLGRFVYYGMVDVMHGISSHVSIGRARKKHGWMNAWFVLVREDPQPSS